MRIRVGCEIAFDFPRPAAAVLMMNLHPCRLPTVKGAELLHTNPDIPLVDYFDHYGNRCTRLVAPAGKMAIGTDAVVEDCGLPDLQVPDAP